MKNTKFIMSYGVAFDEEHEIKQLTNYAKQGWLLEDTFLGGFFYKLRKDKPQDLLYSLDYQQNADEEYFKIFSEAGWNKVISKNNFLHIFSAPIGTNPIYIDSKAEVEKYIKMNTFTKTGSIYSLIAMLISFLLLVVSNTILPTLNPIFKILFIILAAIFIMFFTTYISYNHQSQNVSNNKNINEKSPMRSLFWILYFIVLIIIFINSLYGGILLGVLIVGQSVYTSQRKK